jgi:hypothetical protein
MKIAHFILIGLQTWPPHAILVSDWSISKKSSPLKLLSHMNQNCFLPSFGSFGQVVSEEKIFKNRPIRNKNCLWQSCLLIDRDEVSKIYRGPSIDASYKFFSSETA